MSIYVYTCSNKESIDSIICATPYHRRDQMFSVIKEPWRKFKGTKPEYSNTFTNRQILCKSATGTMVSQENDFNL